MEVQGASSFLIVVINVRPKRTPLYDAALSPHLDQQNTVITQFGANAGLSVDDDGDSSGLRFSAGHNLSFHPTLR
jgi:hypothetical protein